MDTFSKETFLNWDRALQLSALVFGPLLYFLTGIWLERIREKRRRKKEHLNLIKNEVLRPLLDTIESKYEPVVVRKAPPIDIKTNRLWEGKGTDKKQVGLERYFTIPEFQSASDFSSLFKDLLKQVNPYLYKDLENHSGKLFADNEEFRGQFHKFCCMCKKEALTILQQLTEKYKFHERLMFDDSVRIHTHELATAILRRRIGQNINLTRYPSGEYYRVEADHSTVAENLYELPLVKLEQAFEELSEPTETSKVLIKEADRLSAEVKDLKEQLHRLISSEKLKGNCNYI